MSNSPLFSTGKPAYSVNEENGTGFYYYPNGGVALCVASASEYQNSFFAYDKNRKSSLLLAVDEQAVGFVQTATRKGADIDKPTSCVLTRPGCLVSEEGMIVKEWLWERGEQPTDFISVRLNEHLVFSIKSRTEMTVTWSVEGITRVVDMGMKFKRKEESYLKHAKKLGRGQLAPQINSPSLRERTLNFNKEMAFQHNKIHPKSENLSTMVSHIVKGLEVKFGDVRERMATSPGPGVTWKTEALSSTITEIPRIPLSGAETGSFTGFGSQIYTSASKANLSKTQTLPAHLCSPSGVWKNNVEVRAAILEVNPPLKRTSMLNNNSGRYSGSLVVYPDLVSVANPTGMIVPVGKPLEPVKWSSLKVELEQTRAGGAAGGPLIVALVMRTGEPRGCMCERIAALAHLDLHNAGSDAAAGYRAQDYRFIRLDVGDNSDIIAELGLRYLPAFVMFSRGRIVYSGQLGGRMEKSSSASSKPQILIVEPNAKHQINMEKTLRKVGCDTYLCLTANDACDRLHQFSMVGGGKNGGMAFDLVLVSEDILSSDVAALGKKLSANIASKRTVLAGTVSVLGDKGEANLKAVSWPAFVSTEVHVLLKPPLSQVAQVMVQKPIKAASVKHMLDMRTLPESDESFGLTAESMLVQLRLIRESVLGGGGGGGVGMGTGQILRLSCEDVRLRGKALVK